MSFFASFSIKSIPNDIVVFTSLFSGLSEANKSFPNCNACNTLAVKNILLMQVLSNPQPPSSRCWSFSHNTASFIFSISSPEYPVSNNESITTDVVQQLALSETSHATESSALFFFGDFIWCFVF